MKIVLISSNKRCKDRSQNRSADMIIYMTEGLIYGIVLWQSSYIRAAIKSNTHSSCLAQLRFPLAFQTDNHHNFCWDEMFYRQDILLNVPVGSRLINFLQRDWCSSLDMGICGILNKRDNLQHEYVTFSGENRWMTQQMRSWPILCQQITIKTFTAHYSLGFSLPQRPLTAHSSSVHIYTAALPAPYIAAAG